MSYRGEVYAVRVHADNIHVTIHELNGPDLLLLGGDTAINLLEQLDRMEKGWNLGSHLTTYEVFLDAFLDDYIKGQFHE